MADARDPAAAAAASAAANYKKLKEDFVSGLSGGSAAEVNLVTAVAPIAIFTWAVLQRRQSFFRPYTPLAFVVDFLLNVAAILLATTLYANRPVLLGGLLLAQALFLLVLPRPAGSSRRARVPGKNWKSRSKPQQTRLQKDDQSRQSDDGAAAVAQPAPAPAPATLTATPTAASKAGTAALSDLPKKPFLTAYRGCMLVVTCLAILAVDFRIFPRRFAKVETWGTSLMDMGVGSFVFSAGLVAARPVLKERAATATRSNRSSSTKITSSSNNSNNSLTRRLVTSLRHSLPLLVLGVIRLLSVKGLDYAEHVTEYGVHWNFFFTLGLLPPFVAMAQAALHFVPSYAVLALAVAGLYEAALDWTDLKAFVLTAPRVDLLSQNREGLFSFLGYLAIFLAGQDTGMYVLPRGSVWGGRGGGEDKRDKKDKKDKKGQKDQRRGLGSIRIRSLPVQAALWTALHQLSISSSAVGLGLTESRRLANLPYVLWVLSFNTVQLSMFALVDTLLFPGFYEAADAQAEAAAYEEATSPVLRAYNRNGLAVFLLANLLTGLVNMTVPTLDVSQAAAMSILLSYGGVVTGVAVALDRYDITIKL